MKTKPKPSTATPTRREFLTSAATLAAFAALPRPARTQQSLEARLAADPLRPQFHLLPAKNWMNDPNGPIFFNGMYHMFFQYNPHAAVWGDMSWNHAISPDMIHWQHLPVAFEPTPSSPDSFGCFSGSAIAVGKRVYAVYTGTRESTPALATIRDGSDKIQESQCLAWSDDPKLITWTKDPSPIIARPPTGLDITGFRDPSAWKQGDWFYMTVGSGIAKTGGCVLLYRSKDLKQWEYLHPLTSGTWTGKPTPNPCDDGQMWECPEFLPLGDGHVLIYSTEGKVFWQSGQLDPATMLFRPLKTGLLDFDAFYAPKTQLDQHGRRILWGWVPERRDEAAMRAAGWSGMMSLPRVLTLDPDGTLRIQMLPQLTTLRGTSIRQSESRAGQLKILPQAKGEALVKASPSTSDYQLKVSLADDTALMDIHYTQQTRTFSVDGKQIQLQPGDAPTVHLYVDGSALEVILGERIGFTKRFYFNATIAPNVEVLLFGTQAATVEAWNIHPISNDRLTT